MWLKINMQSHYQENCASPAERKTIRIVKGTLYAKAQLLSRDPLIRTRTCSDHCARGTCRGLRRGKNPGWEKFKNEGRDCRVIKNIWEKVRAEPEEKLSLQSLLKEDMDIPMRGFMRRSCSYASTFLINLLANQSIVNEIRRTSNIHQKPLKGPFKVR